MKAFVLIVTFAAAGATEGDRTERIAGFDDYQATLHPPVPGGSRVVEATAIEVKDLNALTRETRFAMQARL
jgi:hypothetical protein